MSQSDAFENDLLKLIFNATPIGNLADNAAASPATNLYVALHTADPGEAGTQSTSEIAYSGYARVAVARTPAGWPVTGNSVSPAASVNFPAAPAGSSGNAAFFSIGTAAAGAGRILYSGALGSNLGPFTGAVSGNAITIPGLAGVAVDDRIAFFPLPGSSLPTGLTAGTIYFVKTLAGEAITVAASQGGAAISITASGDGVASRVAGITIGEGVTPQLGTGTTITLD